MDPFQVPPNAHTSTVPATGPGGGKSDLGRVREIGATPRAESAPSSSPRGVAVATATDDIGKILVPVSAAAGVVLKPENPLFAKLLTVATGFQVDKAEGAVNKLTPGSALLLAPEPIGVLPERAFMAKPQIPGTGIYFDPLYNYTRYRARSFERKRDEASAAQLAAFKSLLPELSNSDLRTILTRTDVKRQFITLVDSRLVDQLARAELDARTVRVNNADVVAERTERLQAAIESEIRFAGEQSAAAVLTATGVVADADPFGIVEYEPAMGSIQPATIHPVTGAALRNEDAAEGIRRELVHDRADP